MNNNLEYYLEEYQKIEDDYNKNLEMTDSIKQIVNKEREFVQDQIVNIKKCLDVLISKRDDLTRKINGLDREIEKKKEDSIKSLISEDNTTYKIKATDYINNLLKTTELTKDDVTIEVLIDTDIVRGEYNTVNEYLNVLIKKYGKDYTNNIPITLAVYLKDSNDYISIDWNTNIKEKDLNNTELIDNLSLTNLANTYTKLAYIGNIDDLEISFTLQDLYLNKMSTLHNFEGLIRNVIIDTLKEQVNNSKEKTYTK